MNDEYFKLYPPNPNTDSKLAIISDKPHYLALTVDSWRRHLPNKLCVVLNNRESVSHQCSALDIQCCIEARISYTINGKVISKALISQPIQVAPELKERLLYEPEPMQARVVVDKFEVGMLVSMMQKKLRFEAGIGQFQLLCSEKTLDADPNPVILQVHLDNSRNQFLNYFSSVLKIAAKFRSTFAVIIFNSKLDRDVLLAQMSAGFRDVKPNSAQNIKILGTSTPRNQPVLKNDGSASSLPSINRSKHKDKSRGKIKISERLNHKKSFTKVSPNKVENSRECLNVFEEDNFAEGNHKTHDNFINDSSMDLRGSFEEFQQNSTIKNDDDVLSNGSFRQKKNWLNPIDQENKRLRQENAQLKQQLEIVLKQNAEIASIKKKYQSLVQENSRLENERRAIIKDKVQFESAYHREAQEKQALRKELELYRGGLRRV